MNPDDPHSPADSRRLILICVTILGAFVKLRKTTDIFFVSVRPYVRTYVRTYAITRLPLDGFS